MTTGPEHNLSLLWAWVPWKKMLLTKSRVQLTGTQTARMKPQNTSLPRDCSLVSDSVSIEQATRILTPTPTPLLLAHGSKTRSHCTRLPCAKNNRFSKEVRRFSVNWESHILFLVTAAQSNRKAVVLSETIRTREAYPNTARKLLKIQRKAKYSAAPDRTSEGLWKPENVQWGSGPHHYAYHGWSKTRKGKYLVHCTFTLAAQPRLYWHLCTQPSPLTTVKDGHQRCHSPEDNATSMARLMQRQKLPCLCPVNSVHTCKPAGTTSCLEYTSLKGIPLLQSAEHCLSAKSNCTVLWTSSARISKKLKQLLTPLTLLIIMAMMTIPSHLQCHLMWVLIHSFIQTEGKEWSLASFRSRQCSWVKTKSYPGHYKCSPEDTNGMRLELL